MDENGALLGSTYPKRAKGLIKNGRARYIDETTISLSACPTENIMEDTTMDINNIKEQQIAEISEISAIENEVVKASKDFGKSIEAEVLTQIDKITKYMIDLSDKNQKLLAEVSDQDSEEIVENIIAAINYTSKLMTETLQRTIGFLEKIYDDKKPPKMTDDIVKIKYLAEAIADYPDEIKADILRKSAQQMFVRPGSEIVR